MLTIREAAKEFKKSTRTIYRDIRSGKLSVHKDNGKTRVDASELVRVYGEPQATETEKELQKSTELSELRAKVTLLEKIQDEKNSRIKELEDHANTLSRLLEHQKPPEKSINKLIDALADRIRGS